MQAFWLIYWGLYGTLFILYILDYYQSIALVELGYTEGNPFVSWLAQGFGWESVLWYKVGMMFVLGILLLIYQLKNRRGI